MRNFHENLMAMVLKHTKERTLIDAWFQGKVFCKFALGTRVGSYVGSQMMRLDTGGTIDFDPTKITGVIFENIIREEDAEIAFRSLTDENSDLRNQVAELTALVGELNQGIDDAQKKSLELIDEVVTSENLEMKRDFGAEGFSEETVEKVGLEPDSTNPDVPQSGTSKDPIKLD